MLCLDSDIIISLLKGDEKTVRTFQRIVSRNDVCTTVLNVQEVLVGVKKKEIRKKFASFFRDLSVIDYTYPTVQSVVDVKNELMKKGVPIGEIDEMIAGICRSARVGVVTRNRKHFSKVKGLKVKSW